MTATATTPGQTVHSPRPAHPHRAVLLVVGFAVLAAVLALAGWLLTSSSLRTAPIAPASAAAPPQPAAAQANADSDAVSVAGSGTYAQFCQASPTLCSPPAAATPLNSGYAQFCVGSPTLCGPPATAPRNSGYAQFCLDSPTLCTVSQRN
jgi:hypothetical protein